ncbi:MAG: Small-conductance mechanosensitive channel MscMJ [Methanomassiliicoccales archaeon PtaB.Bin215]|nr:MAG: Small-conductance mechanosensitive channel MscMJ [Methanomassiliicoccales archaeon PtaB.Bin215]
MRSRTALHLAGLLLLGLIVFSSALAPAVSADPVNAFIVRDSELTTEAGTPASFEWILYNNDSVPYVITPSSDPPGNREFSVGFDQSYLTLNPGESESIIMTVTTLREMSSSTIVFEVRFDITQMNELNNTFFVNGTVQLNVVPVFGESAGDNKILGIWNNELPWPLDGNVGAFVVSVGIWALIALFVILVADPILHRLTSKTATELDDIILRIIRGPVLLLMVLFGAVNSLEIMNLDRTLIADLELAYSVAFILAMAWLSYKIYAGVIVYYGHKLAAKTDSEVDDVLVPILEKLGMIVIPIIALAVILGLFGYNLTVILAGLGFMGIVIGYAAQATLANFFAGMQMMFDRPFKIGDLLRLDNGDICEVRHIGMRATDLYNTFTNEMVVVPNNDIANKKIINMVLPDRRLKIAVGVGVAYGSDVDIVMRLMTEAAHAIPEIMDDPDHLPVIRFTDFADSSLNFTAFLWVKDLDLQFKAASDYRAELLRRFDSNGIEIPFPQSVVWLRDLRKAEES